MADEMTTRMPESVRVRALMASYQAGHIEAFDELYGRLAPTVRRYLSSLARDQSRVDPSRVYVLGTDNAGFTRDAKKSKEEVEELRRLLYVGMTRTMERLVLTCAEERNGASTGGYEFLEEVGIDPVRS